MIDPSFLPTDREVSCHGLVPLHLKMRSRRQRLPLATPKSVQALIVQGITSIVIVIASLSIVSAISIDEDCGGIDSSISSGSNIQEITNIIAWDAITGKDDECLNIKDSLRPSSPYGRYLQTGAGCPSIDAQKLFGADKVSKEVKGLFGANEESDKDNFIDSFFDFYFASQDYEIATGKEIREGHIDNSNDFSEICNRLPLDDNTCYLSKDTTNSFIDKLIAKHVPFGKEIVGAKEQFKDEVEDKKENLEDVEEFFSLRSDLLADKGSCIAANDNMMGIAEYPGLPPPMVYKFCNCISMKTKGVPACTVQPYFRGIAISTSDSEALVFNSKTLGPFPEKSIKIYDGYLEYDLEAKFDVWLDFGLDMKIPKLFPLGAQDLVCKPSEVPVDQEGKKAKDLKIPEIRTKGSLFIKNNIDVQNPDEDGELLLVMAIDEIKMLVFKVFELDLGSAYGAVRIRSENPNCFPSGIFIGGDFEPTFTFGDELKPLLSIIPKRSVSVKAGITWLDDGSAEDESDYLQSFFFNAEMEYGFLGITTTAMIELQYFDDKEFLRRSTLDKDICCSAETGATACGEKNAVLNQFIKKNSPAPTIAIFMSIQDMKFHGGIVMLNEAKLEFIVQIPEREDEFAIQINIEAKVTVLFIAGVRIETGFTLIGDNWEAKFNAELEANVGIGTVIMGVRASAKVGEFTYTAKEARALQQSNSSIANSHRDLDSLSFLDADWDLEFYANWETAEWVKEIGKAVVAALKAVYAAISAVWEGLKDVVAAAWNAVQELAGLIGGAIADLFGSISAGLDDLAEGVERGVDAVADFLDGEGLGALSDVLDVGGEAFTNLIGGASDAFSAAEAIFDGDLEGFADSAIDAITSPWAADVIEDKEVIDLKRNDPTLNCPLYQKRWKECTEIRILWVGVDTCCCSDFKYSQEYIEEDCKNKKLKLYADLKDKQNDAKKKQDCRRESESSNQGLTYAGETGDDELRDGLDVGMENTEDFKIGMSSEMASSDGCKPLPFSVNVNPLDSTSPGFIENSAKKTASGTSRTCFKTSEALENSLADLKKGAGEKAGDAARGEQGLDKDESVSACSNSDSCITPRIVKAPNFRETASVFCNVDFAKLNYKELFGDISTEVDSRCIPKKARFNFLNALPPLSCDPVELKMQRTVHDCCGKKASVDHTLKVEPLPPKITQAPGSMDKPDLQCDSDISPSILGFPTYEPGCPGSQVGKNVDDSNTEFDLDTCTTTIKRKFTITENGCKESAQSFVQTLVLKNDYNPDWDEFPADVKIEVFDEYGTEALGFPTAYQKCNAGPVHISYSDTIEQGSCFAERVLKRTFKAVDVCGHTSERVQTITITNTDGDLPLGEKSLAQIYGRKRAVIESLSSSKKGKGSKGKPNVCLWTANDCGIRSPKLPRTPELPTGKGKGGGKATASPSVAPTSFPLLDGTYKCNTADEDEFSSYQSRLEKLSTSLDLGPTETKCDCAPQDDTCDESTRIVLISQVFAMQLNFGAGTCETVAVKEKNSNLGTKSIVIETITEMDDQSMSKYHDDDNTEPVEITKTVLSGTDNVYNIFEMNASSLEKTIEITTPSLSINLVNVLWENIPIGGKGKGKGKTYSPTISSSPSSQSPASSSPSLSPSILRIDQEVHISNEFSRGVVLSGDGMVANNLLWNVVGDGKVNIKVSPNKVHADWSFSGSMVNSQGTMKSKGKGKGKGGQETHTVRPKVWTGQLFADDVVAENMEFVCGHFSGFATCDDVIPIPPSSAPSQEPSKPMKGKKGNKGKKGKVKTDDTAKNPDLQAIQSDAFQLSIYSWKLVLTSSLVLYWLLV